MSAIAGTTGGLTAEQQTRWAEEAMEHSAHTSTSPTGPRPPIARNVERAFGVFTKAAGMRASTAAISHVYAADFDPLLDKLQEDAGVSVPADSAPRRLEIPPDVTPTQVEALRRQHVAAERAPGATVRDGELEVLRRSSNDLAHAYATNSPMLSSTHADFLATVDRVKGTVLMRSLGRSPDHEGRAR